MRAKQSGGNAGEFCFVRNHRENGTPKNALLAKRCYAAFLERVRESPAGVSEAEKCRRIIEQFVETISSFQN